ncbi:MAG TPA: hypothetical protein PKD85_16755, partial [Saprospiraceae bacterium]|nr:hypothetical protein [Saprospiraceae bacterium]
MNIKVIKKYILTFALLIYFNLDAFPNNGYNLWLHHQPLDAKTLKTNYAFIKGISIHNDLLNDEVINTSSNLL